VELLIELIKVVILGAIEGFTEFLPISSTGHLLIAAKLLDFTPQMGATFEIFIQLGATFAILGYFARDLLGQARVVTHDRSVQRLWLNVVIAFIPAGLIGFVLHKWMKEVLFASPSIIAWALIVGGVIMILVELLPKRSNQTMDARQVSPTQALWVGIAQVLSLIPGVSRSGSTIVGGMLAGINRAAATRFSFYLAIPTTVIATLFELTTSFGGLTPLEIFELVLGMVTAMITAWISIAWLLRYVAHHTLIPFGIYRIAVGLLFIWLVMQKVL
jgi:undecaprenyl-diphosphatase